MRHFRLLSFSFDLLCLSELYLGTYLLESNENQNKIKLACGSHICLQTTYNLIVFTCKYMYANPLTSVVSIQIRPPSYQAGINK